MAQLVEDTPVLKKQVKNIWRTTGREGIELKNGCRTTFRTRTSSGGRGFSADLLVLDEAMVMSRQFMGDVLPTLSARPNAQLIMAGSAGNEDSEAFGDLRRRALSKDPGTLSWYEWSADLCNDLCEPGCTAHDDPGSPATWKKTNPAYGIRIQKDTIADEYRTLSLEEFARERLSVGTWPREDDSFSLIPEESWREQEHELVPPVGKVVFGVSVSMDRTKSVIVAASYIDEDQEKILVEITANDELGVDLDSRPGIKWLKPRLQQLWDSGVAHAIAIDSKSQAVSIAEDLEDNFVVVDSPKAHEFAVACADFARGVVGTDLDDPFIFHAGQAEMKQAVAHTVKRKLSGLWAFGRKEDFSDITSLEAATLAVWSLKQHARHEPGESFWIGRF